jgi:hypothetical protein
MERRKILKEGLTGVKDCEERVPHIFSEQV